MTEEGGTEPPLRVGSRVAFAAHFLHRGRVRVTRRGPRAVPEARSNPATAWAHGHERTLGARDRVQLVIAAYQAGLVTPSGG